MSQWILKLLSGTHIGAELPLQDRDYTVGSGDDCDIVIAEESLEDHAFMLSFVDGDVFLEVLTDRPLRCEGRLMEARRAKVDAFTVYSLGCLHFCFGTSSSVWPDIKIPSDSQNGMYDPPPEVLNKGVMSQASYFTRSKVWVNLSLTFFLVLIGVMLNTSSLDAGMSSTLVSSTISPVPDFSQNPEFSMLTARVDDKTVGQSAQIWLVQGYLKDQIGLTQLKRYLNSLNVQYRLDVRVMESVKRSVEALLSQFRLDHFVVSLGTEPGELVISGETDDEIYWAQRRKSLTTDIPSWVVLSDAVNKDSLEKNDAKPSAKVKLAIRSVSRGLIPYLVLADGKRFVEGSYIGAGYRLEQIQENSVILSRGEERIEYSISP